MSGETKRSECNCICHKGTVAIMHMMPCCIPDDHYERLELKEKITAKNIIETYGESFACRLIKDLEELL